MPETQIMIIGGGSSGLSAAGALHQYGLKSVVLDASKRTGDVWRERYERLRLHTVRGLSHMPYRKLPEDLPRYVSKEAYAAYMENYASTFGLDIRHNVTVKRLARDGNRWLVETENGDNWHAPICIVATGRDRMPFIPDWAGLDLFKGTVIHGNDYKTGRQFARKRVLVVGIGNTGAEVCADLVEQGATHVANSIRTFPTIVPRDPFGIPIHVWGVGLFPFPRALKDAIVRVIARYHLGDLARYGIKPAEWQVFSDARIPMIDVGYIEHLKAGKIHIKPDIERFTEDGVRFVDGSEEAYDAVIAATGYRSGLERFLDVPDVIDGDGNLLVACGEPNQHEGLWFVGLTNSPAGILMAARIQARKLAKQIAEELGITSMVNTGESH